MRASNVNESDQNANGVSRRLFIVGCPRSGTTLLQAIIARCRRVLTFPETGLFLKAFGMRRKSIPCAWVGFTVGKERKALKGLLSKIGRDDLLSIFPPYSPFLKRSIRDVVSVLDRIALDAGADIWLEKTPRHYLHAGDIVRLVPNSNVIHIVRDGREVVASICGRARQYPEAFNRQQKPEYGVRAWNSAVRSHLRFAGQPSHTILSYEKLVDAPRKTMESLCAKLSIDFHETMLTPCNANEFVLPREKWKEGCGDDIRNRNCKFSKLFSPETQRAIEKGLDMKKYRVLLAFSL